MKDKEIVGLYEAYQSIYSNVDEEVETWVNSLVEEGYDLSDYTWDDMVEIYMDEARTDPRGRPASGPMSVYGGRGKPSPDPEGDDNISRMDRAQRRVKRTQPAKKGRAADRLFTYYSARQSGMEHGGEEGPGPKAPSRGGRSGRGANTDRGSGNAAKRRMSEDFDLFDTIIEHLVTEGYADTNESALAIMANMSEDWRESIVEELTGERRKGAEEKLSKYKRNDPHASALIKTIRDKEGSRIGTGKFPTKRGGYGKKGEMKAYSLGGGSDRGEGNKAARRAGKSVQDTRGDED